MQDNTQLPNTFEWILQVHVDSANVDIEVNYENVNIEVHDFECDANIHVDECLLDECLDMDDLFTLKRICEAVIAKRRSEGGV